MAATGVCHGDVFGSRKIDSIKRKATGGKRDVQEHG